MLKYRNYMFFVIFTGIMGLSWLLFRGRKSKRVGQVDRVGDEVLTPERIKEIEATFGQEGFLTPERIKEIKELIQREEDLYQIWRRKYGIEDDNKG